MILSQLNRFSYRMVDHSRYSSQVTFPSKNGLIIYMYFINMHYKHIFMALKFIIFSWHTSSSLWKIKCTITWSSCLLMENLYACQIIGSKTFTNPMTFHTILIIKKIVFTFRRTILRKHIVLPFIITIMMTIIILFLNVFFHIVNHLSSFRLIIYCYHIHTI